MEVGLEEGAHTNVHVEARGEPRLELDTFELRYNRLGVATLHGGGQDTGTIVLVDTDNGVVLAEYRTAPEGQASNPSRTSYDSQGNLWVGNRDIERVENISSVVKIGYVIGGTRCDSEGQPDPNGAYLRPPFTACTAVDRDGDGLIRTSMGLGDILGWGAGADSSRPLNGGEAFVQDAEDECILIYRRMDTPLLRHITVGPDDDVWVGDTPSNSTRFWRLDGETGTLIEEISTLTCVGMGGLVDDFGVLWSASDETDRLMRNDLGSPGAAQCIPIEHSFGLTVDPWGYIWNSQHSKGTISKLSPDGTVIFANKAVPGARVLRGIDCTTDGHVWVPDSTENVVFRLDADGELVGPPIPVGVRPTVLSVDDRGYVWVANRNSSDLMRINPQAGDNGVVDLTLDLTAGSQPQGFSDLTTSIHTEAAMERGYWTVTRDSGVLGTQWTRVEWTEELPWGSAVRAYVRSGEDESALQMSEPVQVENGEAIQADGRLIEVQLRFISARNSFQSPAVLGLSLYGNMPGEACATPNRREAGSLLLFPYYHNEPGRITILTVTNTSHEEVDVEYVYIDASDCGEFNRTHTLTANDTFALFTSSHNPAPDERGYVYVFAKRNGKANVHNNLIGQELLLTGMSTAQQLDYSINAVAFEGIGQNGFTDLDNDGVRDLDGEEYSMAPDKILIPRFFGQTDVQRGLDFEARVILVALTGGARFTTSIDLLVYNDNEEVFSSEYTFACWDYPELTDLTNAFEQTFLDLYTDNDPDELFGADHVETGWFRIDGGSAWSSATTIDDPAVYAVLIDYVGDSAGADLPFEECTQDNGALLPRSVHGGF